MVFKGKEKVDDWNADDADKTDFRGFFCSEYSPQV